MVRTLVGHGIGRRMHEDPQIPNYGEAGRGPELRNGMVLAVEPALYVPGVGGIRLEHTFLVGPDGNEILTRFEHTL